MDFFTPFAKFGPEWLLIAVLLSMVFYLFRKVLIVIENNSSTIAKHSEIISRCSKNQGQ
jgi:hypothetical protein